MTFDNFVDGQQQRQNTYENDAKARRVTQIDSTGSNISPDNPLPIQDIDVSKRYSLNTVFGEKQVGIRSADIAAQFQYGFPASAADPDIQNGGTITTSESMLTVSTGTNAAGSARIANRKALRYIPGHEAYVIFTGVFTQGVADSYQRAGIFDANNGFFVGYEGTDFKFTRRRDGTDYSTIIDLSTFDYEGGTFDPTKGNIYRISFGYLGFATIHLEVLTPKGGWAVLSEIQYPNSSTVSHITNTNLQPRAEVANTGNTTNIVFKTASFSAGIINGGGSDPAARNFAFSLPNNSITAGTYHFIMFRSKSTFASLTNYIQSALTLMSIATDLSKNSVWEFRKNMTITNTPTWTDVNTSDSTIEYSTDATVTAGTGTVELAFTMAKSDRLFEQLREQESELFPGDTLSLVITTPGGTTGTFDVALRWKELF